MFYRTRVPGNRSFTLQDQGFFYLFCSCDLDLDPTTVIYELGPYPLAVYRMCEKDLRTSRLPKVIIGQTCIRTYSYGAKIICDTASRVVN